MRWPERESLRALNATWRGIYVPKSSIANNRQQQTEKAQAGRSLTSTHPAGKIKRKTHVCSYEAKGNLHDAGVIRKNPMQVLKASQHATPSGYKVQEKIPACQVETEAQHGRPEAGTSFRKGAAIPHSGYTGTCIQIAKAMITFEDERWREKHSCEQRYRCSRSVIADAVEILRTSKSTS